MEQYTHELSLAGTPAAGPRGYVSWAFGQGARDPYYILVVIYIFYPYFSNPWSGIRSRVRACTVTPTP